jgi:hypothetical protein
MSYKIGKTGKFATDSILPESIDSKYAKDVGGPFMGPRTYRGLQAKEGGGS